MRHKLLVRKIFSVRPIQQAMLLPFLFLAFLQTFTPTSARVHFLNVSVFLTIRSKFHEG
jgi:hypothetical protein